MSVINICEWHALAIDCGAEGRSESNSQSIHQRNPIAGVTQSQILFMTDGRNFARSEYGAICRNGEIQECDTLPETDQGVKQSKQHNLEAIEQSFAMLCHWVEF